MKKSSTSAHKTQKGVAPDNSINIHSHPGATWVAELLFAKAKLPKGDDLCNWQLCREWSGAEKIIEMKNFEKISKDQLCLLKGGRTVEKVDLDNDGKWDIKIVTRNNGTMVIKTR